LILNSSSDKSSVALAQCRGYVFSEVFSSVQKVISGLFPNYDDLPFKPGLKVFLNPNLLSPRTPEEAVTTHPVFMEAVIQLLLDYGCNVVLGDDPSFGRNIQELYDKTGVTGLAKRFNIKVVTLQKEGVVKLKVNNAKVPEVYISRLIYDTDYVISLPKWKTHNLTVITVGVKNSYGLLPGVQKANYHKVFPDPYLFSEFLIDLFGAYHPDLFLMDGVLAMDGEGPAGGRIFNGNLIAGSKDALALDSVIARIMGIIPDEIDFLKIGGEKGYGMIDSGNIRIIGESIESFQKTDFQVPSVETVRLAVKILPGFLVNWVKFYPYINPKLCISCRKCEETCPVQAIFMRDKKMKIDYNKCIGCLCCKEVCPVDAVEVRLSAFFRFLKKIKKIFSGRRKKGKKKDEKA